MESSQARALRGPGLFEIAFGVVISLSAGIVLAAAWLVLKPVVTVKEPVASPVYHEVAYVPGAVNAVTGRTWMRKKQLLMEGQGGDLALTEPELNAWAAAALKPPAADATALLSPGQLNLRVRGGVLQFASPATLDLVGFSFPLILQVRGTFNNAGDHPVFVPTEIYLGSLATHRIPRLAAWTFAYYRQLQPFPEDVTTAWQRLSKASVDGDSLVLSLP
jgi:hypothetical protein